MKYRWLVLFDRGDPVLDALTAYTVKHILAQHGFSVVVLEQGCIGYTVSHPSRSAMTVLLLKNQFPASVVVEEISV
jgi:G3E family GTPase